MTKRSCQIKKYLYFDGIGSIPSPSPQHNPTPQPVFDDWSRGGPDALHSLEDGVCVQVHAAHVRRWVIQVKVAGVQSHDEGTGGAQHVSQGQWTEGDVRARPVEGENHLRTTAGGQEVTKDS